jgi:hypothetical protein
MFSRSSRLRAAVMRASGVLGAAILVIFLISQAPHLVHHIFEPDGTQDECPLASAGERPAACTTPTAILPPSIPVAEHSPTAAPLPRSSPLLVAAARAPPTSS